MGRLCLCESWRSRLRPGLQAASACLFAGSVTPTAVRSPLAWATGAALLRPGVAMPVRWLAVRAMPALRAGAARRTWRRRVVHAHGTAGLETGDGFHRDIGLEQPLDLA